MPLYFIYPVYTAIIALTVVVLVPRKEIRYLTLYGILFGGVENIAAILPIVKLSGAGSFLNYGPFGFMGIPFFPPIAWTAYFTLYFYFLPRYKPWKYMFPLIGASFSVLFSNVLVNLHVFNWNYSRLVIPFIIYLSWYSTATWGYLRLTQKSQNLVLEPHMPVRFRFVTAPAKKLELRGKKVKVRKSFKIK